MLFQWRNQFWQSFEEGCQKALPERGEGGGVGVCVGGWVGGRR